MDNTEQKPLIELEFTVFADYHHFYVEDEQENDGEDIPDDWGESLEEHMIAVAPGSIGVTTARNMTVPVRVEFFDSSPSSYDFSEWDHVAEASLNVSSGLISIGSMDYPGSEPQISVVPGVYRVRAYYRGLDTLSEDGLEGDDFYLVVIWPDEYNKPLEVLKRRSSID